MPFDEGYRHHFRFSSEFCSLLHVFLILISLVVIVPWQLVNGTIEGKSENRIGIVVCFYSDYRTSS